MDTISYKKCYPFVNSVGTLKSKKQLKRSFKCKNQKIYAKKNNFTYLLYPEEKLNDCVTEYNSTQKQIQIEIDDIYPRCRDDTFDDINPDVVNLYTYLEQLALELKIDRTVYEFMQYLITYTNISIEVLNEMLKGAFIVIRDNGFIFNKFSRNPNSRKCNLSGRMPESSHNSVGDQYRIGNGIIYNCDTDTGECIKTKSNSVFDLLIGTSIIEPFYGCTWFQFEYANLNNSYNKYWLHAVAYAKYKFKNKNVGPLGESRYAEYVDILILDVCYDDCEKCDPTPCITRKQDIFTTSYDFLNDNRIVLSEYNALKTIIKIPKGNHTLTEVYELIDDYIFENEEELSPSVYDILTNISYYMKKLGIDNTFSQNECLCILFLIYYYIPFKKTKKYLPIIKAKIQDRYIFEGGKLKNKNKNKTIKYKH
jgi:hypothetical protein